MTTAAQEAFLRAFHTEHPAITSGMLGAGRGPDNRSTYQILCDRVSGRARVLDLGCGDGLLLELLARTEGRHVAGIDLSAAELAIARRRPGLAGAPLAAARAQRLPLRDAGFDACVSHMAFMLMAEIDQVASEVARVLAPAGVFACAIGGGAAGGEAYGLFLDLIRPAIDAVPAAARIPRLGDRRTRSRDGLDSVLGPAGFAPVEWDTVRIDVSAPVEQVWTVVNRIYDLDAIDPRAVAAVRDTFRVEAAKITPPDGRTPCAMHMHIASTRLR